MRQNIAAFRNRLRLSERNSNRFWLGAIIFAIALPIIAMAYEMFRHNLLATIVFILIIAIWGAVMWWGARQPATSGTAQSAPVAPTTPKAPAVSQTTAKQPTQPDARKQGNTSNKRSGRN